MIDRLEMLIALAREKHFGKAAESLGVAQPTLSSGIRQLEGQLGVQLVWRGSRYGGLTPEGQRTLEWARRIVGDARSLKDEMRSRHEGLAGMLRLAVIPTALSVAADLSARFRAEHPRVGLTILSRSSIEILDMIENLQVDAGLSYVDNEPLGRLTAVPLYRESYALICPPDGELAGREAVDWSELGHLPLCLLTPDMQNRRIVSQLFLRAGVTVAPRVESNSTVVLMAHVAGGGYATILPAQLAAFLAVGHNVRVVPIRETERHYSVGLIALHREPHTPVLEAFLSEARRTADAFR